MTRKEPTRLDVINALIPMADMPGEPAQWIKAQLDMVLEFDTNPRTMVQQAFILGYIAHREDWPIT